MPILKRIQRLLITKLILLGVIINSSAQTWNPNHSIGTLSGNYNSATIVWPEQLVEIQPAGVPNTGLTYQWEKSLSPVTDFTAIAGATASSYSLSNPLQTTYYRRKTTNGSAQFIYSNTIKIALVSPGWEDINYIREYNIATTAITTSSAVYALAIGAKTETTSYMDGLGRPTQQISKETATPALPAGTWGDMVQFHQYDADGTESKKYLPFVTTSQPGKFKTAVLTEQPQYYTTNYNETSAFSLLSFDNSPLSRVTNVKKPGTAWAAGAGNSAVYDINDDADYVRLFSVDYIQGNSPVSTGYYPAKTLYKITTTDENGKKVIGYSNKSGQLILKKVQLDDSPANAYTGWICTYSVYDDFGLLRFQLQPEAVKYLEANSWSFAGLNGQKVLDEWCFQYNYDDKGRNTWKKAPGALPLKMIYDNRDRVVFMQDGNQAVLATPQWTATIYDELDRPVITTLYNTTKSIATLQTEINSAAVNTSITISNTANNGGSSVTVKTSYNPVTQTSLNDPAVTIVLSYQFYDDYSYAGVKTFNTGFTNTTAYSTSDPNVQPIATTNRVTNMPTGSRTRVLGGTKFLFASQYFDERGLPVQSLEDNILTGVDINTVQYHFDGRILSTCSDHTTSGTGYTNYKILSKYLFDKLGRITSLQKQFGANAFKTIATYDYDDIGRVKTKHLDPGYTAGGNADLESLNYSFNMHGQITGINKDYALKTPGTYNKWGHFFGLYLGFDNRDNVFTNANLNGQVTGLLWNTQGDDAQRKYDYTYDNAGRLVNALFTEKQKPGDSWSSTKMDFSVSGYTGKITYDLNGNLLSMLQKGVVPGTATPITVDDLRYTYASYSNKLQTVTDQMTATASNGLFGDFKDGSNGASPDYIYDDNGNVIVDLNKNAQSLNAGAAGTKGIQYNFLDKPEIIRITGKGHIRIVYDATGNKLQKAFIPDGGGAAIITSYVNGYEYQKSEVITTSTATPFAITGSNVTAINFEEGRIRVVTPYTSPASIYDGLTVDGNMDLPNSKRGAYDYYIMDYQQNVRMILTEETHTAYNTATMETSRSALEESIFGQTGAANEVATTRVAKPVAWTNAAIGSYVSKLGNNAGKNIGPNTLQKVMAGDKITATVQYYHGGSSGGNSTSIVSSVLSSMVQAISGSAAAAVVKNNAAAISSQLNGLPGFTAAVQPNGSSPAGTIPQAFLTVLFFDERFNLIDVADGGVVQKQVEATVGANGLPLQIPNDSKAPKNGYVYVYVSNQSNQDVFFDNLKVTVSTGNIIEENHYYAYGLKIAAISSRKLPDSYEGAIKNNYLYNGKELFEEGDLNWYDYGFRNYDPQIGRFLQLDPLTHEYPFLTPFQYASCDPITNIDIDGLEGCPAVAGMVGYIGNVGSVASAGAAIFNGISAVTRIIGVTASVANFAGNVINTSSQQSLVKQQLAGNSINGDYATNTVGIRAGGPNAEENSDESLQQIPGKIVPYLVYEALTPETYNHIKDATSTNKLGQKGHPLLLTYDGDALRRDNRRKANLLKSGLESLPDPWRDEYPFACTYESVNASVRYVPMWEQRIQAGELSVLSATLQPFDKIQVILIPKAAPPVLAPVVTKELLKKWKTSPKWQLKPIEDPDAVTTGIQTAAILYGVWWIIKICAAPSTGGASLLIP